MGEELTMARMPGTIEIQGSVILGVGDVLYNAADFTLALPITSNRSGVDIGVDSLRPQLVVALREAAAEIEATLAEAVPG
ncbi:hypothetical protein AS850_02760 [Frondihabitans sp. 762G35]|nr:hypothetical protein AS850_02760 [Frondihabitans sp. 762G35]